MSRRYENELSALYFTLDQAVKKRDNAYSPSEERRYEELIESTIQQIEYRIKKLEANENEELLINDQLEGYRVLNSYNEDYTIPEGYEASATYSTWLEANQYIKYLKDLSKDPSYMISILGYYIDEEDYVQVIFKVRASY